MGDNVLLWALKLVLGALLLMPFVGMTGCAWINYWYKAKTEFTAKQAKAQAEALKAMAERMKDSINNL